MEPDNLWYAWYSSEQEKRYNKMGCQASFYFNEKGEEIRITEVSRNETPTSLWQDLIYKGKVVKFSRPAEPIIPETQFSLARLQRQAEDAEERYNRYQGE